MECVGFFSYLIFHFIFLVQIPTIFGAEFFFRFIFLHFFARLIEIDQINFSKEKN